MILNGKGMRPIFFISGLMGSGKSKVADIIKFRQYDVIKMDDYSKDFMLKSDECKIKLVKCFGKDVITDNGEIDIDFIKSQYFNEKYTQKRETFEEYLDYELFLKIDEMKGLKPLFLEVPLFNIVRYNRLLFLFKPRLILNVSVDDNIRKDRLKYKRGLSEEHIAEREKLQNIGEIEGVSEIYNIENNGTEEELFDKITDFFEFNLTKYVKEDEINEMFNDYVEGKPEYLKKNLRCYVFYNSIGCARCPFPCSNSNKHFEEIIKRRNMKDIK